jgi:sugar lactone lactonase YvrE
MVVNRVAAVGPARLVGDLRTVVGESLVWSGRDEALFFVDIVGRRIVRYQPATDRFRSWQTPEFATSIGLRSEGGFILGLEKRVCAWTPDGGFGETLAVPEPEVPDNRLNEGAVAPDGSYWLGTMQTNLDAAGNPRAQTRRSGAYYRLTPDLKVERLTPPDYGITNTMAWLPGGRFVTADTVSNTLYAFRMRAPGVIADRTIFNAGFPRGLPDGSCLDEEGCLWNCRVAGGACLVRFAPTGAVDRVVELPCSWPTSCTFGGADLGTLFVGTARFTMSEEHLAGHPQEGALLALDVGVRGVPAHLFG